MADAKDWMDYTAFALGAIGSGLGLWSAYCHYRDSRVSLRVTPRLSVLQDQDESGQELWFSTAVPDGRVARMLESGRFFKWQISVVNLSKFPVRISEVGFEGANEKSIIPAPVVSGGNVFPTKLEPRESVVLSCAINMPLPSNIGPSSRVFVRTDCGHRAYGASKVFERYLVDGHERVACLHKVGNSK